MEGHQLKPWPGTGNHGARDRLVYTAAQQVFVENWSAGRQGQPDSAPRVRAVTQASVLRGGEWWGLWLVPCCPSQG